MYGVPTESVRKGENVTSAVLPRFGTEVTNCRPLMRSDLGPLSVTKGAPTLIDGGAWNRPKESWSFRGGSIPILLAGYSTTLAPAGLLHTPDVSRGPTPIPRRVREPPLRQANAKESKSPTRAHTETDLKLARLPRARSRTLLGRRSVYAPPRELPLRTPVANCWQEHQLKKISKAVHTTTGTVECKIFRLLCPTTSPAGKQWKLVDGACGQSSLLGAWYWLAYVLNASERSWPGA